MTMCSRCGVEHQRQKQRYCTRCHAAYMREWRKTHPLTPEQRHKDACRSYAGVYKRRGHLSPEPCQNCGNPEVEMHHPDYDVPLAVIWLCRPCHLARHVTRETVGLPVIAVQEPQREFFNHHGFVGFDVLDKYTKDGVDID